ncbi:BatD family protein [Marinilabilia salmonicolor]|uniref:BatD family protein n=1 Tax=Marinilabilia salmonicolor TaxID=989 RepID=UPI0002E46058|nr:BatD family protein [Marinilabilia salmonicolor]
MKSYILFILLLIPLALPAQDVEFKATGPNSVEEGRRFQLIYRVNKAGNNLLLPELDNFNVLMGPTTSQRSQVQIINGKVSREEEYTYTYILKAKALGTFTIPAATIEVDDKKYESNTLEIKVVEAGQEPEQTPGTTNNESGAIGDDDLYITMVANKTRVYQNQPVLLTTKIYTRVNLEGISDIQHPTFRNFIAEDITGEGNIEWSLENINGRTYRVGTYNQKVIYPQTSGQLKIEPVSIEFLVRIRQTRQSNNIFDNFFDTHRTVRRTVTSKGVTLNVNSLPSPQPDNFSGVVGSVDMEVSLTKNQVKVNDGITVKTIISGTGNLKVAGEPKINIPPDFDVFDPNSTSNLSITAGGHKGSKTYEQLIIPRHSGTFEISPVEYVYFDPNLGQYRTLKSQALSIQVESNGQEATTSTEQIRGPGAANRESVKFVGKDIRYIRTGESKLQPVNTFFFGSWKFIMGYLIPLLIFIIVALIYRQKIKENANLSLKRTKQANKVARKRLKKAAHHLKSGNNEAFYEELSKGLWGYISDKLSIPLADLNLENIRQELEANGAQSDNSEKLIEIIDTCEYARYAPAGEASKKEELYQSAIEVISKLESNLKKRKTS